MDSPALFVEHREELVALTDGDEPVLAKITIEWRTPPGHPGMVKLEGYTLEGCTLEGYPK